MYAAYLMIIVINIFFASIKKYSRVILILSMGLLLVLVAGNVAGADVHSYLIMYEGAKKGVNLHGEIGYYALEYLFAHVLKWNFWLFRLFIVILCYGLVFKGISYFSVSKHWIIAMYMGYLFIMDTIQFRNFLAMSLLVFAFHYLMSDDKKEWIKYVFFIIIAATFQVIILYTLSFLIYKCKNKKIMNGLIVFVAVTSFGISLINRDKINPIFSFIINNLLEGRGANYLSQRTHNAPIGIIGLYCIDMCILIYIYMLKKKHMNEEQQKYHDYIWRIHCLLILIFPLLLRSISFYRIIRNVCLLKYIDYAKMIDRLKINTVHRFILVFAISISIFLWGFVDCILINPFEVVVEPIFEKNCFWGIDRAPSIMKFFLS